MCAVVAFAHDIATISVPVVAFVADTLSNEAALQTRRAVLHAEVIAFEQHGRISLLREFPTLVRALEAAIKEVAS